MTQQNSTVTFNISGLPDHVLLGVNLGFESQWGNDAEDTDTITYTIGDQSPESWTFGPDYTTDGFSTYKVFRHTGTTLTVTLTAQNQEQYDYAYPYWLGIATVDPTIEVASNVITTDDTEDLTVTVKDPSGTPMDGVALNLTGYDDEIIEPQQSNATTDGDGKAVFEVNGVAAGTSPLIIVAGGPPSSPTAPRKATTQPVADGSIQWLIGPSPEELLPVGHIDIHAGQTIETVVRLKKADGTPWTSKQIDVSSADEGHTIEVAPRGGSTTTDESGFLHVKITGLKKNDVQLGADAIAKVGANVVSDLLVHVHGIIITFITPQQGAGVPLGTTRTILARITSDWTGEPLQGMTITAAKHAGPGPMTVTTQIGTSTGTLQNPNDALVQFEVSVPLGDDGGVSGNYEVMLSLIVNPDDNNAILKLTVP